MIRLAFGFFLALFFPLTWLQAFTADVAAQFKGYYPVDQLVVERLMLPGSDFKLGNYLGTGTGSDSSGTTVTFPAELVELLGVFKSDGVNPGFRNGQPNGINVLLWYLLFDQLSTDVAGLCENKSPLPLNAEFRGDAMAVCTWPQTQAPEVLQAYWLALMGYDAPETEFMAWRDQVVANFSGKSGKEALYGMSMLAFMNPYFLLRH